MANDALVDDELMIECFILLHDEGGPKLYDEFCKLEPVLAAFAAKRARMMAGTMALRKVPRSLMMECHFEMLELAALCFHAQRLAHAKLWEDLIRDGKYPALKKVQDACDQDNKKEEGGAELDSPRDDEEQGPF